MVIISDEAITSVRLFVLLALYLALDCLVVV